MKSKRSLEAKLFPSFGGEYEAHAPALISPPMVIFCPDRECYRTNNHRPLVLRRMFSLPRAKQEELQCNHDRRSRRGVPEQRRPWPVGTRLHCHCDLLRVPGTSIIWLHWHRWLLHSTWDVAHQLHGSPIIPSVPTSSFGCAICDPVIAVWCFAGGPSVRDVFRRKQHALN